MKPRLGHGLAATVALAALLVGGLAGCGTSAKSDANAGKPSDQSADNTGGEATPDQTGDGGDCNGTTAQTVQLGAELECDGWKFKLTAFTMDDVPAADVVSTPGFTPSPDHRYASVTIEVSQKGEVKTGDSGHRLINNLAVEGKDIYIFPMNEWDNAQDSGKFYFDLGSGGSNSWTPGSGTLLAGVGTPARPYDFVNVVLSL